MFRALVLATLLATLAVNIFFLFAAKDKPPDLPAGSSTLVSVVTSSAGAPESSQRPLQRRLFLRSNDFYDYSPPAPNESSQPVEAAAAAAAAASKQQVISAPPSSPGDEGRRARSSVAPSESAEREKQPAISTFVYDNYNAQPAHTSAQGAPADHNATNSRPGDSDNEISRPNADTSSLATTTKQSDRKQPIRLRVKSSRDHVLISLDGSIIYESGAPATNARLGSFKKRRARHRRRQRPNNNENANQLQNVASSQPAPGEGEGDDKPPETAATDESARGIHVLVLNQFDGSIMARRRFDTYTPQQDDELAHFLHQIQPGRLLVLAVQDEGSFKMPANSAARRLLRALGSRHIGELGWRDMWALVLVKRQQRLLETDRRIGESRAQRWRRLAAEGGDNLAEAISHSAGFAQWAQPVEIETEVALERASWPPEGCFASDPRRLHFCSRVEGYGRVCDCRSPDQIDFEPRAVAESRLARVPIVVIASDRPYYLHRMLRSLLQADGVEAAMVTVFIDGFYEEPAEVCKLFNLRYIQHKPTGVRSARISNHYKTSLALTFQQLFSEAPHALIFEEDLEVAPDALLYFNAALPVLEQDKSLYCISAWNDQGYEHSVGSLEQVQRVETMPGLGWLLSRELFLEELLPAWPGAERQHDWDMWLRSAAARKGRECLIPEISRTFHFGSTGTNINSYFQRQYFNKHAFSAHYLEGRARVEFAALDQLAGWKYDALLEGLIRRESNIISWPPAGGSLVGTSAGNSNATLDAERDFLCSLANLTHYFGAREPESDSNKSAGHDIGTHATSRLRESARRETKARTNVIFIKMIEPDDFGNWLELAKCWRLWDLDARGQHKATWRLHLNGRPTLIVGHPASPFSSLKPANLVPFDLRAPI